MNWEGILVAWLVAFVLLGLLYFDGRNKKPGEPK